VNLQAGVSKKITIAPSGYAKPGVGEQGQAWWKQAVVYQVYPRSFNDSNNDGIGDINGITEKLDYIASLGVDVIWLNPIFMSPNHDNGYDISDYKRIMPEFGTLADFENMLAQAHDKGLKVILDFVPNHCSSEHEWFQQARQSRDNPYRDFFHWWPAEKGLPPKRWSFFAVDASAWRYEKKTNSYYLHYFSATQPDLNWENPAVRQAMYQIMHFWLKKGVDGFRMDVLPFISKDTAFPELPASFQGDFVKYYAQGPHLQQYLAEMYDQVLSHYNIMTVAEGTGVTTDTVMNFIDPKRKALNLLYHDEGMNLGYLPNQFKTLPESGYKLTEFKQLYTKWNDAVKSAWGSVCLGNHDQARMVSRWGNDSEAYREVSAKMLMTFLLTMRATPFFYAGDELAMSNIGFDDISDYRDIETLNMYQQIKENGGDLHAFIESQKITARDNSRTPFQWGTQAFAGFSEAKPWIRVNPNYKTVNAAEQQTRKNSPLNYFRKLIQLRKQTPALLHGEYQLLDADNPDVFVYLRQHQSQFVLVALNFKADKSAFDAQGWIRRKRLLGNYKSDNMELSQLRPYEAIVMEVTS